MNFTSRKNSLIHAQPACNNTDRRFLITILLLCDRQQQPIHHEKLICGNNFPFDRLSIGSSAETRSHRQAKERNHVSYR